MLYRTSTVKEMKEGERARILNCTDNALKSIGINAGLELLVIRKRKSGGIFIIGGRRFALCAELFGSIRVQREDANR